MEVLNSPQKNTHSPIRLPFRRASAIGYKKHSDIANSGFSFSTARQDQRCASSETLQHNSTVLHYVSSMT